MKLNKIQILEAMESLMSSIERGVDDADIQHEMGLTIVEYEKLKSDMLDAKSDDIMKRPVEHTYVQYILDQMRNVHDLTDIINQHKNTKSVNAAVSAIRVRSEITDKIIEKGQDFGIIHKEADKKEVKGGFLVAQLTSEQLKSAITAELKNLNDMMSTYGESANMIDVDPGDIHLGPANPELMASSNVETDETAKSKAKPKKGRKGGRVKFTAK